MKQTTTPKLLKTVIAFVLLAVLMLPGQQAAAQCCQNWVANEGTNNVAIPINNGWSANTVQGSGTFTYMNLNNGWPYYVESNGALTPNLTIMGSPGWTNVSCGTTFPRAWTHVTTANGANTSLLETSCTTGCTQWCGTPKSVPSGCCMTTGSSASLRFRTNFSPPNAISGTESICNNAAQSAITASGFTGAVEQMSFDWYYRNDGTNPSSGGGTFYTTTNGSASMTPPATTTTRSWNCVYYPTGSYGTYAAWGTGTYAIKTIYPVIVPGSTSGSSTVCTGVQPGTFTATASGGNGTYTYDWYYLDNAACPSTGTYVYTGYSQTTGGTSTYTPGIVTAPGGLIRKYQAYVSGCNNFGNGWTSGCGTLTVQSNTNNVGTISAPAVVCPGAAFTVSNVTAATTGTPAPTGPTYNFYLQKTDAPNIAGWASVSGAGQVASSWGYTMPNAPGTYQVTRNSANGCASEASSNVVSISVPNTFNAGTTQADQTVCQVSGPAGLTSLSAAVGGNGSYTYGWQSSTDNSIFTDIAATNSTTYTPPSTVGTIYYRRKVSETGGCFTSPIYTGTPQNIAFTGATTNVTISGNTITKTTANGWDGGAYSLIPIHKGGYVECKSTQTGTDKMFGLNSDPAADASYCSIDYAAYFTGTQVACYENCGGAGSITGSYVVGDVFRVQWNATTNRIDYSKNGVVTLSSGVVPVSTLYADFSLYQPGCALNSIVVQGDDNSKVVVQPTPGVPTVNGTTTNFAVSFCGSGTLSCVQGWENQLLGSGPLASTCALYKGGVFQSFGTSFPITTAGTYTVYSYNNNTGTGVPCQGNVGVTVTVTLTPSFTVALTKSNYNGYNVSCSNSANGTITATPSANVYNMTYQWSTGTTNTVVSPNTFNTITGLSPGTYFVTVGDASGCEASASAVISAPPAVTVSLTPLSYGTGYGTNCAGASTGGVTSFPGGGTAAGWGYTWTSTPSGFVNPGTQAIGSVIARTYNVTVTESNGCTASASVALTDPSVITFTTSTGYACSGSTYTDGIVTIVASGGASGTYNYRRDGGAWQSSPIFSGNTNGSTHSFQVQDATYTSCLSATSNVTVTYPPNGVAVADCNFIYVSTTGDPSGTLGSKLCPVTLTQAFVIYAGTPARSHILMGSGTYNFGSTISIPGSITIDGGYDPNTWVKSTSTATILNISPPVVDNASYGTGYYIGMQPAAGGWKLQDLTINVQPGGASGTYQSKGRSIFGVYINGQTGWTMTRCVVTTGSASAGLNGSGNTGSYSTGGAGGGGGGSGGGCSSCGANGGNGTVGSAGAAGGGGGGRCCSGGCNFFGCNSNGCNAANGSAGADGGAGATGGAGNQASGLNVFYVPQNGTNGGTAGSGGGGGGGGGGAYGTCCSCTCGPYNAQGGAGGQGGYGGAGGLLGYGGGSAVAIYAYGGTGTLTDVNLAPGAAGAGGAGAGGVGGGGTGGYYYGSDNSGWCDGGKGGTGAPGGFGGTGGAGGAGATGYSSTIQALNGASISWTGATVPNDGTVTANWYSGCTNSEIVITKTSGSAWTGIATDPAFELNSTSGGTTYGTGSSTAVIYYTTTGVKNLSLGSTTLNKFIKVNGPRLITPASSIISALENPCPLGAISVSHTLSAGQILNTTAYDWKISDVTTPTVYIYNANSPNPAATPATVNPPSGGWLLGHTYQIRLQLTEACCGPSIPMYSSFTIPSALAQVTTITQSPSGTVCSEQSGVTYTASAVAGATGYTWTVTGGGVITAGQGTDAITVDWGAAVNGATVSVVPTNACAPSTNGPIKTNTFNVNGSPIATITPQGPTTFCSGGSVSLLAGASGGGGLGNGAMTYSWAPVSGAGLSSLSGTPVTATPPSGGVYTYTVVATEGGSGCTASASEIVTMQSVPTAGSISTAQTICYGGDPAAFTSVAGTGYTGTTLTYRWERSVSPFSSWSTVSGNPTTATYDEPNGLLVTTQFRRTTIANLTGVLCESSPTTPIQITVNPNFVVGSIGTDQTICYNTTPAALTNITSPTGGTGSYTYQWQIATAFAGPFSPIGGASADNYAPGVLSASRYYKRVETSGTCGTLTSNIVSVVVNPNLLAGTIAGAQTICYNTVPASLTSSTLPTGGNGTYTYDWQSATAVGGPFTSIGGAASTTYGPGALIATTYYRRAETSGAGCGTVYSNVVAVTVRPDVVAGTITASQTICYNTVPAILNNSVFPTGGTGVFSYLWESSPDNGITPFASISGSIFNSYAPGALTSTTYFRRTETSTLGCGSVVSNVLTITVNPQLIAGSVAASQTICYGATPAALTSTGLPTGGVGTYTYQWKSSLNNSTYTAIGGETNTTYVPGALTATTYYRRDETSGTCGTVPSNVITITVPAQVVFTTSLTNVVCNADGNGTITVDGSGGVSPYTYSKNAGGSYVSGADPYTFTGLVPGTYNIGILDTNNCPSSFTAVNITEPAILSFTESHSPVTCSGGNTGSITVTAAGGTTGYLYSKNNGASYQVSNVFTTLSVGSYDVVVKDANNCVTAATTVVITGPTPISFTPSVVHVLCNGDNTGSITLSASGGTPGYTYSKDNGSNYQLSNVFASLPQGIYAMKVKDANLCTATTQIVQVTEPTLVTYSTSSTNVVCNGANDGTITIDGNGGVAPYTYSINNGAAFQVGANPFTFSSLTPGTYLAGLKDDNGCVKGFTSISISEPSAVTFSTSKVDVLCFGGNNASITVSASGGTGTLSYSKNNGATYQSSNIFSTLIAGTYQIKVKDASGCETVAQSVTITQPAVGLTVTSSNGCPYSTTVVASLFSAPAGGTPSYTYAWSGPFGYSSALQNPTRSPTVVTMSGTYRVTVTDANGCSATAQTVMTVYDGYVWKGTVSSDWADNTNWQFQVPDYPDDCTQNAFIQSGTPFSPNVNIPGLTVGTVTLVNGATLNLGNSLTICRTLSGSTFSPYSVINGPATLIMKSIPSVQEKITNLVKFNATLQIDNSAGVVVNAGNAQIVNVLELKSGVLSPAAAGNLTFISNSSTHCAIIDNFSAGMSGSISGSVTMQRKYDAPTAPFYKTQHYVSSPANTLPLSQLGANGTPGYVINTTCNERMSSPGSPYGDVAQYDEDHGAGCTLQGWKILNTGTATNGRGYSMGKNGAGLLTVTGAPNQATSYTRAGLTNSNWSNTTLQGYLDVSGWHMIGNPWLANLRITTNGGAGFDNQVAVWQTTGPFAGAFSYYQVGFDNVDIAPFQGFFVRKSNPGGTATYTINGTDRVRTPSSMPFYSLSLDQQLDVYVEDANGFMDKAVVGFSVDATDTFDAVYDANKIAASGRVLLYSMNNNLPLARNILTSIKTTSTVDLAFDPGNTGSFKMRFDKINTFDPTSYVMLEDKKTNLWYDAKDTSGYLFTADTSDARNRFVLHFTPATEITHTDATCTSQGTIKVTQPGTATWTYTVADNNLTVISTGTLNDASPITVNANPGVYDITLIDNNNYTVVKQVQVTGGQQVQSSFTASDLVIEEGVEITLNSTSTNATGNFWNFGDTDTASGLTVSHTYAAPGTYTVTLTSDNTDCNAVSTQQITVTAKVVSNLNSITDKTGINIWSYGNTVFVDFHKQMKEQATIEIYNVLGQQLSNEPSGHSNVYHKTFTNLEASYAIVRVKNNDVITTRKVFISGK